MNDVALKVFVRGGMVFGGVAMLGLVTLITRNRKSERTKPLTPWSGRRGPLLAIAVFGGIVALIGQWTRGSYSEETPPAHMAVMFVGFALAIAGFWAWSRLMKTQQD